MKIVVIIAAIALFFLHQDFWLWNDGRLLWGFMPAGLAYHAVYSIGTGILWALAVIYAWPRTIDDQLSDEAAGPPEGSTHA